MTGHQQTLTGRKQECGNREPVLQNDWVFQRSGGEMGGDRRGWRDGSGLRALTTFAVAPDLVSSTCLVAHNHL